MTTGFHPLSKTRSGGVGYGGEQAYVILGVVPVEFRISCIVMIPNPTVTLYLPVDIFDRDVLPTTRH
ncbi:acetamidase/formamidase family protein [Streptosporangium canum]|uniref:acetamidase/formamidase family protein n=1 Tax=Streptosporangium canum TaxID=324952 RepID=UPI0036C483E6